MNKKRILIVDDEVTITRLLKLNLEKTGHYEVRAENQGTHALPAAREFKPDLVLLDVMMPDMHGGDVAAQLTSEPNFKGVPVLFLTAAVRQEEISTRDGILGGFRYIAKPHNVRSVIAVLEQMLAQDPQAA